MTNVEAGISYSGTVFIVVFITCCILNLLKRHYIFQLIGVAFFFTLCVVRPLRILRSNENALFSDVYYSILPMLAGISACLISMVLGFWIFPHIRRKLNNGRH